MRIFVFMTALLLASCGAQHSESVAESVDKREFNILKERVDRLAEQNLSRLSKDRDVAYLTPTERSYQFLHTDVGTLALIIEGVRPLANGSEIDLTIGNPTTATITRFKATFEWGAVDDQGYEIQGKSQSMEREAGKPLQPGTWNSIRIQLANAPPDKLGFVRVSKVEVSEIALRRP